MIELQILIRAMIQIQRGVFEHVVQIHRLIGSMIQSHKLRVSMVQKSYSNMIT